MKYRNSIVFYILISLSSTSILADTTQSLWRSCLNFVADLVAPRQSLPDLIQTTNRAFLEMAKQIPVPQYSKNHVYLVNLRTREVVVYYDRSESGGGIARADWRLALNYEDEWEAFGRPGKYRFVLSPEMQSGSDYYHETYLQKIL